MTFLQLGFGLVLLVIGGELLVKGSVDIARRLNLPALLIGVVIIGFGTSMPELMVSLDAALRGAPGLSVGNVFGSNISNTLLILGLSAVLFTVARPTKYLKRDCLLLLAATVGIVLVCLQGLLPSWQGGILFALLLWMTVSEYRRCRKAQACETEDQAEEISDAKPLSPLTAAAFLAAGFAGLFYGADFFVDGAVALAHYLGVSDTFIGLTVAAIGTSLPELFVTLTATRRGQSEMAFGNVVGSNLFNILGVLGVTALVEPLHIPKNLTLIDGPAMIVATALVMWFLFKDSKLSRGEGVIMLTLYAGYLVLRYFYAQAA